MLAVERAQFPVNEAGVVRTFANRPSIYLPSQHSTFSKITSQMLHSVTAASTGNITADVENIEFAILEGHTIEGICRCRCGPHGRGSLSGDKSFKKQDTGS